MQYLVLTHDNGTINWNNHTILLKAEAAYVWELYKNNKIRSIWFTDHKDAVLLLEADTKDQATVMIEELPLVKSKLINYTIETLLPYTGLERILDGTN